MTSRLRQQPLVKKGKKSFTFAQSEDNFKANEDVDQDLYVQARVLRSNAFWESIGFPDDLDLDLLDAECNDRCKGGEYKTKIDMREGKGHRKKPFPTRTGDTFAFRIDCVNPAAGTNIGGVNVVMKDAFSEVTHLARIEDVKHGEFFFFAQRHEGDNEAGEPTAYMIGEDGKPARRGATEEKKAEAETETEAEAETLTPQDGEPDDSDLESDGEPTESKYKYASKHLRMRGSDRVCANVLNVGLEKEGQGSFQIRCDNPDIQVVATWFFLSYVQPKRSDGVVADSDDDIDEDECDDDF